MSHAPAALICIAGGAALIGAGCGAGTRTTAARPHDKQCVVKVFFDRGTTRKQVVGVYSRLEANELVRSIEYVSAAEGLKRMQKKNPELFDSSKLPYNPLGPALTIVPKDDADTEEIAQSVAPYPRGVHDVNYGRC